uniref:Uncharacterized protein n=1 Tax=Cacopsylla melanoneura TaxID=428564 RepID=A0A8D8UGG0_9HEMI
MYTFSFLYITTFPHTPQVLLSAVESQSPVNVESHDIVAVGKKTSHVSNEIYLQRVFSPHQTIKHCALFRQRNPIMHRGKKKKTKQKQQQQIQLRIQMPKMVS